MANCNCGGLVQQFGLCWFQFRSEKSNVGKTATLHTHAALDVFLILELHYFFGYVRRSVHNPLTTAFVSFSGGEYRCFGVHFSPLQ